MDAYAACRVPDLGGSLARGHAHSADRWNLGAVTSTKIFDALSVRTGMAREQVEAHARRCCEQLVFNETAWRVAKEHWLLQALVTVNPDLFTDHIVPVHDLTAVFDVIVVSSAEGTDDKSATERSLVSGTRARVRPHC